MAVKKDLSLKYLGVDCLNPFFLSSSPVGGNYDMVAKCYETGWGGCFFKTIGIFVADECSPRFDQTNKEGLPWLGFKNMEQISDKPTEVNFEYMYRLNRDYPEHITVASIMGSSVDEWKKLAKMADECGAKIIEGNFSCPQIQSKSSCTQYRRYLQTTVRFSSLPFPCRFSVEMFPLIVLLYVLVSNVPLIIISSRHPMPTRETPSESIGPGKPS